MSTERLRASDAEREQVAKVMRAAMAEGRLTLAEGEDRLAAVYAAVYRDELTPLVADLPGGGWHALRDTPEAKAGARRHARGRFGFVGVLAAVIIGLFLLTGGGLWLLIPLFFFGFAGLSRGCGRGQHGYRGAAPPWAAHRSR
jgi:hypothetical protein